MVNNECAHELSYKKHISHIDNYANENKSLSKTWYEADTVDAWRHERMYKCLDSIIETEINAKWLTVGDGRYGSDAKYLFDKGSDVMATDISDILLKEASEVGYIGKYSKENVEYLSFCDSEYDYILCKESYHHFPRPMIALYEMLRVASKGIILIEPTDPYINVRWSEVLFRNITDFIKAACGKSFLKHSYEEVGNYVYTISKREIEKFAVGMNCKMVVFKGINDYYETGVEYDKISNNSKLYKKIKFKINWFNLLVKMKLMNPGILFAMIFKEVPSDDLLQKLSKEGNEVIYLPQNPYI